MEKELIEKGYIPLNKSWINRMGILDLVNGKHDIVDFLAKQKNLGDDLLALKRAADSWATTEPINVGESGTLYRYLKYASWKLGLNKQFILHGTLKDRSITDDPSVVKLSQKELLKLDHNTSQWASAATLLGDKERLTEAPYHLKMTYEAVDYWKNQRQKGESWEPRYDRTILNQALAYLKLLKGEPTKFVPEQSEDFCFAYAFGFVTAEEGNRLWPNLKGNETDRVSEMKKVMEGLKNGKPVDSKDHRVVQAAAMWGKVNKKEVTVTYPEVVNKSWPQFWDFLNRTEDPQ